MERLSGLDACFAHLDTPQAPLGVAMVCTFDHTEGEPYSYGRARATVDQRLRLIPPLRRRLVPGPAGLDRPRWVEDPDFDLDDHLRRDQLAEPGGDEALTAVTADLLARPFPRDRPLWDMTFVEGLGEDRSASVTRVHHAAIDGVSGAEALANFLDLTPGAAMAPPGEDSWRPEPLPSLAGIAIDTARAAIGRPVETLRRFGRVAAAGQRLLRHARDHSRPLLNFPAPRTPLNGRLSAQRSVAFARVELSDLHRIRAGVAASINDVLLALCSRSLRAYLSRRDALPDQPLIAAVPVSVRGINEGAANQVSGTLVELATGADHPLEQLQRTQAAAREAKTQHQALGAHTVADLTELAPAPLLRGVAALERTIGVSSWLPPAANVVVSNFPGPPVPLYFAGAPLTAAYPLGPIAFGAALNITAQSYLGTLHIGLNACPDVVDDVTEIADGLTDATKDLLDVTA